MSHYLIPTSRELVRINPDKLVCVVASGNYSTIYHVEDCKQSESLKAEDFMPYEGGPKMVLMQLELSDNATFHVCRKASIRALQQVKDYLEQKEEILRDDYKRSKK